MTGKILIIGFLDIDAYSSACLHGEIEALCGIKITRYSY